MRNRTWFAPIVVLALLLAACGAPSTSTSSSGSASASGSSATNASGGSSASGSASAGASGSAAGSGAASDEALTIPCVMKSTTSPYWQLVWGGCQAAAEANPNITVSLEGASEETDVEGQIRVLETLITQRPAAIAVAPSQADQVQPILQQAVDAGTPVVLFDTDIPGFTAKSAFVGTDNRLGGQLAGEYIAEQLNNTGNVAIIRGAAGDPVHNQREEGATTALEAAGVTVVNVQPADSDRAKGQSVAENLLTANPDLQAIYATNDEMALGALQAAQTAGRPLIIIGFDASADALQSIQDGGLTGSIAQFPDKIGQLGVETAAQVARGETVEAFVNTGVDLVTAENVSEFQQ